MAIYVSAVYAILFLAAPNAATVVSKNAPKPIARGNASVLDVGIAAADASARRNWPRIAAIVVDWALFLTLLKILLDRLP